MNEARQPTYFSGLLRQKGLAMTSKKAIIASEMRQSNALFWIASAKRPRNDKPKNPIIASEARRSSALFWIASAKRPRNDKQKSRHCERSAAIHAFSGLLTFSPARSLKNLPIKSAMLEMTSLERISQELDGPT
jgi:hypothetical protein